MTGKRLNKILLAEDEADIRTIEKLSLEKVGKFEVSFCVNGREVIEKVDAYNPDLIMLDVMMPEMDGVAAYEALRKNPAHQKTPVIFMTAKIQPTEVQAYLKMGAIGVIHKPFDPMKLPELIRNIWESYQGK